MRQPRRWIGICLSGALFAAGGSAWAAQAVSDAVTKTTQLVLTLDRPDAVAVQTRVETDPPALILEFPDERITGSLPERSRVHHGLITGIHTRYHDPTSAEPQFSRAIQSVRIELTDLYPHRVNAESGRIVVEFDHPATVMGDSLEITLRDGMILSGLARESISERFRAMETALADASPVAWTWRATFPRRPEAPEPSGAAVAPQTGSPMAAVPQPMVQSRAAPAGPARGAQPWSAWFWMAAGCAFIIGAVWTAFRWRARPLFRSLGIRTPPPTAASLDSWRLLIDQLVRRSFERQGHQVIRTVELAQPKGLMHLCAKDGTKSALLCLANGAFFERNTVEQFLQAMHDAGIEQGFLVASGAFTIPAQRRAKEANITLISREELVELLSAGATSEYFTKQLEEVHGKLTGAKETLEHYAHELETLRRQRNEASWYLGEERARSATLETQAARLTQEARHQDVEAQRWQQELREVQKRWDESQWFLGEARTRLRFLEEQLGQFQSLAHDVEALQQARDEAHRTLGAVRAERDALSAQLKALREEFEAVSTRERALREQADELTEELDVLRQYGERRQADRAHVNEARLEVLDDQQAVLFSGTPRDLSASGFGVETERSLPVREAVRVRLLLPGRQPIATTAKLVWQQPQGTNTHFRHGGLFVGLAESDRAVITQIVASN